MLRLLYRAAVVSTFTRVVVTGSSMYPTLDSGEYVLFNRLAYVRRSPRRGDIVLVRRPLEKEKAIIKRVVGIPGDTVQLSRGVVRVNGAPLEGAPSRPFGQNICEVRVYSVLSPASSGALSAAASSGSG